MSKISIIGSGFSGLSAACFLAKQGHQVEVFEKNNSVGGRAQSFSANGFTFDMGPSWYWMPDVFERFFDQFGKKVEDYYTLKRLNPSYRVIFDKNESIDVPAHTSELYELFESIETGSGNKLRKFLDEASYKYEVGVKNLVYKPGMSPLEFVRLDVLKGALKLQLFSSIGKHIKDQFKDPKLRSILEFPSLFLGATPDNTPALYSLMNYADLALGTWYPMGGMHEIPKAMHSLAEELGVKFHFNAPVSEIVVQNGHAKSLISNSQDYTSDYIISAADYEHTESQLLPKSYQSYTSKYWNNRVLAPSALIYYLGINKKIDNLLHHNLFFDEDFPKHAEELYDQPQWPSKPLFYTCAPSKTDPSVAPEGKENIFILIPVAPDLKEKAETADYYLDIVLKRMEQYTGTDIKSHIEYKRAFTVKDFKKEYNSFKGNAYGLANTLMQTAFLKPKIKSRKISNLFYSGQLTVPGPGVPPALISGEVTANYLTSNYIKQ